MNISKHDTEFGEFFILNNDQWIGKSIKSGKAWDANKIKYLLKLLPRNINILDIGANIGTHTIPYAKHANNVYSFEPQKVIYDLLLKNIEINALNNIHTYNIALGHFIGSTNLTDKIPDGSNKGNIIDYNTDKEINYGGIEIGMGGECIKMSTIDSYNFDNIGFIKIDVEGCEKLVIYGGKETIKRCRPIILYENKKNISKSMLKVMNISKDILKFDINKYLIEELGYKTIKHIQKDILLIP